MPDSDLDPYDFSLSHDNNFSGSDNAKLNRVFTDWAKMLSVTRGGGGVPVTHYSDRDRTRPGASGLAAITAWHCVSSVNTDDSRVVL